MPLIPQYKRILLKLSGEGMTGDQSYGLDEKIVVHIAEEIKLIHEAGIQICLVIGGGNIFRGARQKGFEIDRATGDYMGMLATVLNALALQDALEKLSVHTLVLSAIEMH